jgi:hypothetical protein
VWPIRGVAQSVKNLSLTQLAALINKKQDNFNILDFMWNRKLYQKIFEENKILKMFYEEYTIFNLTVHCT